MPAAKSMAEQKQKSLKLPVALVPDGHAHWTIRLLEDPMKIELDEPISREAIRRSKKKQLRPHRSNYQRFLNRADAEFVACIEDVLGKYELPYTPDIPVVCMDEKPYQLLGEARESWAMRPGDNKKIYSEYTRNGFKHEHP